MIETESKEKRGPGRPAAALKQRTQCRVQVPNWVLEEVLPHMEGNSEPDKLARLVEIGAKVLNSGSPSTELGQFAEFLRRDGTSAAGHKALLKILDDYFTKGNHQ